MYKYNFKFEIRCPEFRPYHKFTNNKFKTLFGQAFGIDESLVEVYYIYSIRNGVVCYVEIVQNINNISVVETVFLCAQNPTQATEKGSKQNIDLRRDICKQFGFSPTSENPSVEDAAFASMTIRVEAENTGLEFNRADSVSAAVESSHDLAHSVAKQLEYTTPGGMTQQQKALELAGTSPSLRSAYSGSAFGSRTEETVQQPYMLDNNDSFNIGDLEADHDNNEQNGVKDAAEGASKKVGDSGSGEANQGEESLSKADELPNEGVVSDRARGDTIRS